MMVKFLSQSMREKSNCVIYQECRAKAKKFTMVFHRFCALSRQFTYVKSYTIFLNVFALILHVTGLLGVRFNGDWSALGLTFNVANR